MNSDTDSRHCGRCGLACGNGERCLNGRCYSDDIRAFEHKACPDCKRCGADDSDCFRGATGGRATVCFQDGNFRENPQPCQSNNDCKGGRVCIDSSDCCADFNLPDVPRTCVLPCGNLAAASAGAGAARRQGSNGAEGPGRG